MSRGRGANTLEVPTHTQHLPAVCGQSTSLCCVEVQCGASAQSVPLFLCCFFLTNRVAGRRSGLGKNRFPPTPRSLGLSEYMDPRRCTCQGHCSQHCFCFGETIHRWYRAHYPATCRMCVHVSLCNCHHPKMCCTPVWYTPGCCLTRISGR